MRASASTDGLPGARRLYKVKSVPGLRTSNEYPLSGIGPFGHSRFPIMNVCAYIVYPYFGIDLRRRESRDTFSA